MDRTHNVKKKFPWNGEVSLATTSHDTWYRMVVVVVVVVVVECYCFLINIIVEPPGESQSRLVSTVCSLFTKSRFLSRRNAEVPIWVFWCCWVLEASKSALPSRRGAFFHRKVAPRRDETLLLVFALSKVMLPSRRGAIFAYIHKT